MCEEFEENMSPEVFESLTEALREAEKSLEEFIPETEESASNLEAVRRLERKPHKDLFVRG